MRLTDADILDLLRTSRRIAVVGLGEKPHRPAYGVAAYLQRAGYTIIPVHPIARTVLGEPVARTLVEAAESGPIDIVNVFRRSETIPDLVDGCVAVRPRLVWLQVGIHHAASARLLESAGIPVVQDRCLAVDHHSMGV
ncbi:MAG: CoA-binding protein [Gemmatimonadales bacterium]|nr:CoA-binding protein [Gemmatimonadales bacterium]